MVQRSPARNRIADQFALACPDQGHQREIIAQARIRYAARFVEHPERQATFSEIKLPALSRVQIDKRKLGALRPDQRRFGANRASISERVTIAR